MANEFCSDEPKISYSNDAIDIKQLQERISETTKLEIVHEFYLKNNCRSLISENLFLHYSPVCRVINMDLTSKYLIGNLRENMQRLINVLLLNPKYMNLLETNEDDFDLAMFRSS